MCKGYKIKTVSITIKLLPAPASSGREWVK